jgi:hypothetical protein
VDLGNAGPATFSDWEVVVDVSTATISNVWSGTYARATGSKEIVVKPASYNKTIGAYKSLNFGFCSTSATSVARPKLVSSTVEMSGLRINSSTPYDWGTGYCSLLVVTNSRLTTLTAVTVVVDIGEATVNNLWGATYEVVNGSTVIAQAADDILPLAPGASAELGYCADATGTNYGVAIVSASAVE